MSTFDRHAMPGETDREVDTEALQRENEKVAEDFDRHDGIRPETLRS